MSHQMAATPEASVIICAHYPREDYFRRAIAVMRHQSLSMAKWAFLLVDNASDVSLSSLRTFHGIRMRITFVKSNLEWLLRVADECGRRLPIC